MKIVALSLFLPVLFCWLAPLVRAADRPNVLLILVDDLRPSLGAYGDEHAVTPNLDKLASSGMRFDMAYCNIALCAPSRFSLMTGSRPTSTGIYGFNSDFRRSYPDAVTLSQHFMKHGYTAEALGKVYHIGHGCNNDEASWSVPHLEDLVVEYRNPKSNDGELTREEALFTNKNAAGLPRGMAWEATDLPDDAYADGRMAKEACKRLEKAAENSGQPFFMALGIARPHLPFCVPQKYWDLHDPEKLPMPEIDVAPENALPEALKHGEEITQYKPLPEEHREPISDAFKRKLIHGYYASASYADAQIGKVLDTLDKTGLAENTIVVLWGDHGYLLGEMGMWTKHVNYELANRIPLIIRAPGVTKAGGATGQLTETVDLYPTLAELCGLPKPEGPQPIDGMSMVPVLKDPEKRVRDHAYHGFPRQRLGRAIRTDRYRLVEWRVPGTPQEDAAVELYDYSSGLIETKNIAEERPEVVAELRAILARHPEAIRRGSRP